MASAAPLSSGGTSRQQRTISMDEGLRSRLLARGAAVYHHDGLAFKHGLAVDRGVASERGAALVGIERGDLECRHYLVADIDGRPELHTLGEVDAARPRQFGAKHGG